MSLRHFLTHHRWQKIFALLLATLIWFTVRQGVDRNSGPAFRTFSPVPIRVLTLASDLDQFRVSPSEVTVILRGKPDVLSMLSTRSIEAYVNLSDNVAAPGRKLGVQVNAGGRRGRLRLPGRGRDRTIGLPCPVSPSLKRKESHLP